MGCCASQTAHADVEHPASQALFAEATKAKCKRCEEQAKVISELSQTIDELRSTLDKLESHDPELATLECRLVSGDFLANIHLNALEPCSTLIEKLTAELASNGTRQCFKLLIFEKEVRGDKLLSEYGVTPGAHVNVTVVMVQLTTGLVSLSLVHPVPGTNGRVQAYLDDVTDGGGWLLFWCYAHQGGTNPDLVPGKLPTDPEAGFSHASFLTLEHALGTQLQSSDVAEVRFYARSSGHNRVMHFKTANRGVAKMVAGEAGDASGFGTCAVSGAAGWWQGDNWSALEGHSAKLPRSGNGWWGSFGHFFVFEAGVRTWAIKGSGYRWEVDDHVAHRECAGPVANADGYDGTSRTTLHQIWVRFHPHVLTMSPA